MLSSISPPIKKRIMQLPIGLVFLDKWVTGNQITGDWRCFNTRNTSIIIWESHREHKCVQIFLLGNKWLYFSGKLDILQRENRVHGLHMNNQNKFGAYKESPPTVLTAHTEWMAVSTSSKWITRKTTKDLAQVTILQWNHFLCNQAAKIIKTLRKSHLRSKSTVVVRNPAP